MVGVTTKIRIKFGREEANQSKKRGVEELEDVHANKKQKLDRHLSSQCLTLLRLLMEHPNGWLFNKPVDPVQLKIPDYFSVISNPMDLGTIKSKLFKNVYSTEEEFTGDVRLTFANAMKYNPPDNPVHEIAKELKQIFEVKWDSLKKKDKSEKVSLLSKPLKVHTPTVTVTKLRIKQQPDLGLPTVKIPNKAPATTFKCVSCCMITCMCLKSCNSSGSEVSSLTDCHVMNTPGSQVSESDPHYNGSVSSKKEKNGCVSSLLDVPSNHALFSNELKMPFPDMPPLPPEKALRAATLKAKFAETILKAKHRKVLDQSSKVDLITLHIEKEQMERAQREEKARIEAEMRAAKLASRMRAETERKQQREREKLKMAKVERTCYFDDSNKGLDYELVKLCGSSQLTRNGLFELGLFLRNDDCVEESESLEVCDAVRVDDLEEGEII